jgi:hypothetical protein
METSSLSRLAISLFAAIVLAGCGGITQPATPIANQQNQSRTIKHSTSSCPCLYVANVNNSVTVYADGAKGNAKPIQTITGSKTGLSSPSDVAVDSSGNIYVSNYEGGGSDVGSVTVYTAGANGNVSPIETISGPGTGINEPLGVALDPANEDIYVANSGNGDLDPSVTFYPPGSNGNASPAGTIAGSYTGLYITNTPTGIALDANGYLYVPNYAASSVTIYAPGASGNVAPTYMISCRCGPQAVALDSKDNVYESYLSSTGIDVYAPQESGYFKLLQDIAGKKTKQYYLGGVAVDTTDNIYVANEVDPNFPPKDDDFIVVYKSGANGDVKPLRTIKGSKTGLNDPQGIAVR